MQTTVPLACFLSLIRPPGIQFENSLLQIAPVNKGKCPYVRDNADIVFQLYTRHNPTVAHSLLIDDDERLFASSIDFNDPTVIYFHAFMETPDDGSALMIREAYTHRGDTNVIMVDAQRLEAGPWYFKAAENTWYIGRIGAQFIDYLVSRGLKLSKTHLIGHSLGAQSAGVAGSSIKSGRVSRITGLDPALPLFNKLPLEQRLDPTDAEFVDVIHTDAGIFGFPEQVGHADFYPNGGISPQPGCELEVVIPQQQILPKCNNQQPIGTYEYHLIDNASNLKKRNADNIQKIITITKTLNAIRNIIQTNQNQQDSFTKYINLGQDITNVWNTIAEFAKNQKFDSSKVLPVNLFGNGNNHRGRRNVQKFVNKSYQKQFYYQNPNFQNPNFPDPNFQNPNFQNPNFPDPNFQNPNFQNPNFQNPDFQNPNFQAQGYQKPVYHYGHFGIFKKLFSFFHRVPHNEPVVTVNRQINTIINNGHSVVNQSIMEQNNYTQYYKYPVNPLVHKVNINSDSKLKKFFKKLFGFGKDTSIIYA